MPTTSRNLFLLVAFTLLLGATLACSLGPLGAPTHPHAHIHFYAFTYADLLAYGHRHPFTDRNADPYPHPQPIGHAHRYPHPASNRHHHTFRTLHDRGRPPRGG